MTAQNSSTPSLNNTPSNTHDYLHQKPPPQLSSVSGHTPGPTSHPLLPQQYPNVNHRSNSDLHQSYSSTVPSSSSALSLFPSAEPTSRHHSVSSSSASNHPTHPTHQQRLSSQLLPPSSSTTPPSNIFVGSAVKPAGGGGGSAGSPHLRSLVIAQVNLLFSTTNERNYEGISKEIRKVGVYLSFCALISPVVVRPLPCTN